MKSRDSPKYIQVWWNTLVDYDLKPTDLLLAYLINRYCQNKHRACYASKQTMANLLNVSVDTIYNSLNKLQKQGIIYRVSKSINNRRTYIIYMTDRWKEYLQNIKDWQLYE